MNHLLRLGLSILPIAVLVWLTFGRTNMKVSGIASDLPVGPHRGLLEDPLCSLEGIVITEIVTLKDDLLVGYRGGRGSWFAADPPNPERLLVTTELCDAVGQILLPMVLRDTRSMRILSEWRANQTRLISVVSRSQKVVALADTRNRNAVVANLTNRL